MKIYTKTGDSGETSLFGGKRVAKDAVRLEAYGTIDELNAALGVAYASAEDRTSREVIHWLQNTLFVAGGDLASPIEDGSQTMKTQRIDDSHVQKAEMFIDMLQQELPELREFILPGGTACAAALHLARTICRRAERIIITLGKTEDINKNLVIFTNRISDLLFVLARWENMKSGYSDIKWEK